MNNDAKDGEDLDPTEPTAHGGPERDRTAARNKTPSEPIDVVVSRSASRRYDVVELLGKGGMGEVHLAIDERVGRDVAVKLLLDLKHGQKQMLARFRREARIQGTLEHPGVVPVYDLDHDESGRAFFVMKRVAGVTLETVIIGVAEGDPEFVEKYPLQRLLSAFLQICLTIDYAHSRGVVHRDLKLSNLMLGDFGEVYVLDWGIAKILDEDELARVPGSGEHAAQTGTRHDDLLGTLGFMAPEQIKDSVNVDARSDVYALGAILFALVAQQRLHPNGDHEGIAKATLEGVEARPSVRSPRLDTPPELDIVCARATEVDPERRYASARELHDAVQRFLEGDRDTRLRAALAARHVADANQALRARSVEEVPTEERSYALRQAGRALALHPESEEAAQLLASLMFAPPTEIPEEVRRETQALGDLELARAQSTGGYAFFGLVGLVALLMWVGVRSWTGLAWIVVPLLVAEASTIVLDKVAGNLASAACISIAIAASTQLAGALWLPMLFALSYIAVITATHALGRWRLACVAMALSAVVIPWALGYLGVTSSQYTFSDGWLHVRPNIVELHERAELAMAIGSLATVLLVFGALWHFSRTDMEARRRLQLLAWHLRQVAPPVDTEAGRTMVSTIPPASLPGRASEPVPRTTSGAKPPRASAPDDAKPVMPPDDTVTRAERIPQTRNK